MKKIFIILAICVLKLCALTDNTSKNFTDFLTQKDSYTHNDEKKYNDGFVKYSEKKYDEAVKIWGDLCDDKDMRSCVNIGFLYDNGLGVKADKNKAKKFYEKACFGEDWLGCKNLAITYFKNQNFSKAAEIFAKGCELKDGFSCANLGYQYENGDGVVKDELKAIEFYKKGCIYEDGFACLNLGVSEANGNNFNEAQKLFKKACELGNKNACDYYKQITDDEFKKAHK